MPHARSFASLRMTHFQDDDLIERLWVILRDFNPEGSGVHTDTA
jgi:hypothetical protein